MKCVQGALKTTFINPHSFSDDFLPVNALAGDDFFVDGLLDFSSDGDGDFEEENFNNHNQIIQETNNDKPSSISTPVTENNVNTTDFSIPADDVADLEWVSRFVDDELFGVFSLTFPAGKLPEKKSEPETLVTVKPSFTTPVLTKARSKRTRTGGRVWSLGSSPSTSTSSSSSCTSNPWLFFHDSSQTAESVGNPVKKQRKRNPVQANDVAGSSLQQPRRCSHCLVQKTPQWRAGPLGAKTLCNACGVRFKSGRLLPEYRPACSPTFSSEVHSNNHRKVLEMRQQKEAAEAGLVVPVQRF